MRTTTTLAITFLILMAPTLAYESNTTAFACNPDIGIYGNHCPDTTIKSNVTVNASGYYSTFDEPVFNQEYVVSIHINQTQLDDHHIGYYVGGILREEHIASGGNPWDPFAPANWHNEDLEDYTAYIELHDHGERIYGGEHNTKNSGRWSSALAKKSQKFKKLPMTPFSDEKLKIRVRQGSQDWDSGLALRDCYASRLMTPLNVEAMPCEPVAVFLNAEFWGSYHLRADVDNRYLGVFYPINKDDVVLLEMNGIVDEGDDEDNQAYFAFNEWLQTTNLSDNASYAYFTSVVNEESLIDYYFIHTFIQNQDFPNDHRFWRNKNNVTQVPGTPYDGRWYFHPKDKDQSFGLYDAAHVEYNDLQSYLSDDGWETLWFRKAMENHEFRVKYVHRSRELLNNTYHPEHMLLELNGLLAEKKALEPYEFSRWKKAPWTSKVDEMKEWLIIRHAAYGLHLDTINITLPDDGNQTQPPNDDLDSCLLALEAAQQKNNAYRSFLALIRELIDEALA